MKVSNDSLRNFARAEISDAIDNISDLKSRFEDNDVMSDYLSKIITLLDVADDLLERFIFSA